MNKFEKVHGLEYWLSKVQLVLFLDLQKASESERKAHEGRGWGLRAKRARIFLWGAHPLPSQVFRPTNPR